MLQRKHYIFGFVGAVLVIAAVSGFILIGRGKKALDAPSSSVADTAGSATYAVTNTVVVQDSDGITKSVDIASGDIEDAGALEREDFSGFSGLPKLGVADGKDLEQDFVLVSKDKSEAIVTIVMYDAQAGTDASVASQAVLGTDTYICDVTQKKCGSSDILSRPYQGLDPNLQKATGSLWWYAWDSAKHTLYGHFTGEDTGDVSPVYACDTESKTCSKTSGFDTQKPGDTRAVVPEGAFSPSLSKFVMVVQNDTPDEKTGAAWQLLLYASDDLSKPMKTYDISAAIDHNANVAYDSVQSVAWSGDETKIAIGTARQIFMFDTETGGLSLAFVAPPNEDGDAYWDSSALFMTSDAKYIAFVDESDLVDDASASSTDEDGTPINILKKIDLGNANATSELLEGPGLGIK